MLFFLPDLKYELKGHLWLNGPCSCTTKVYLLPEVPAGGSMRQRCLVSILLIVGGNNPQPPL